MQHWTEYCLFYFNDKKYISGFKIPNLNESSQILELADSRKTSESQLWIVGGSDSKGVGVLPEQRYGQLIANHFGLPVSFLTVIGSSIQWAADQILRSDIRPGDTVIWGLVPPTRFPFYKDNDVVHVSWHRYKKTPDLIKYIDIDQLDNSNTLLYRPIISISQVQNVCNKLGVNLIIAGLAPRCEYLPFVATFKNFIHLHDRFGLVETERFLDFGSDGDHPGPQTHQWYADQIITKIVNLSNKIV